MQFSAGRSSGGEDRVGMESEVRRKGSERGARSRMWGGHDDWRRTAALPVVYYYYFPMVSFTIIVFPIFWMVGWFCEARGR